MTNRDTAQAVGRNDDGARHDAAALPRRTNERADLRYEWRQGRLPGDRYVCVVRRQALADDPASVDAPDDGR
jgi:hypothetical protein